MTYPTRQAAIAVIARTVAKGCTIRLIPVHLADGTWTIWEAR